jgi:hypothetical protein
MLAAVDQRSLICAALRGEAIRWPGTNDSGEESRFVAMARYHGILPLLGERLDALAGNQGWPVAVLEACHREAASQRILELAGRAELPRVLEALAEVAVKPLVLKGGALAYTHYPTPALRPRSDTDLLIPQAQKAHAEDALRRLGYGGSAAVSGDLVAYQATWSRKDSLQIVHALDIHWRINNSQILARLLGYDELEPHALSLPPLGPNAYGLAPVHALLFACMHRAGHRNAPFHVDGLAYPGADRLIWLYDIHLLISGMSDVELTEFVELATAKRLKAVCLEALDRSAECFGTLIAPPIAQGLRHKGPIEPAARYLAGGRLRQMAGDFFSLDGWGQRAHFFRELAFPSGAYMRIKYCDTTVRWLPVLYARRAVHGLWHAVFPRKLDGRY